MLPWFRLWQFESARKLAAACAAAHEAHSRMYEARAEHTRARASLLDIGAILEIDALDRQRRRTEAEKGKRLAELQGDRRILEEELAIESLRRKKAHVRTDGRAECRSRADQYASDLRATVEESRAIRKERDKLIAEIIEAAGGEDKLTDEQRHDIENIKDATEALLNKLRLDAE